MTTANLGRLEQVDLRHAWQTEAGDFTPWLAQENNLALLGDTIGIELELEAQEKNVGPFRADILCKDTGNSNWVLIENQLERTDHTHLGQLLTYAAGLKAVTIVWIAHQITEEHRAALDWLNEITDDRFNFFGLEVELWRIGDSPIAPKFNVACKPNDWSRTISKAASRIDDAEVTETKQLQQEYWTELRKLLLETNSPVRPQKPLPQHWTNFAIGRSYFSLVAIANTRDTRVGVGLSCGGDEGKAHFYLLRESKVEIEKEFGQGLEWQELPGKKESRVMLRSHNTDPLDKEDWTKQHHWIKQTLERFHTVFRQRVKMLDASQWQTDDEEPQA